MSTTPTAPVVAKATFTVVPAPNMTTAATNVTVNFNPASLTYSVENTIGQQGKTQATQQFVSHSTAKLSMDLLFDSTDTGSDVRLITGNFALYMQSSGDSSASGQNASAAQAKTSGTASPGPAKTPPILKFEWGTYYFQGVMESFKETIDFFSAEGVALRSTVSIGLSRQDQVFNQFEPNSAPANVGSTLPTSTTSSVTSIASQGGNPYAARSLGTTNGLESLRFTGGASLQVGGGVHLNPPAAFVTASASAGAGLGISAGASFGVSAGASAGISAGASFGASASAGAGLGATFGSSASAGVPATAGAFAGLQTGVATVSSTVYLNVTQMAPATIGSDVSTFAGASFSIGGAANNTGSAGLSADVGATYNFNNRLTFSSGS